MITLMEALATELERPRELSAKVVNYISETYDVDRDSVGPFLADVLPHLEDYEIDLILSPVFTPKLADQAVFAQLLALDTIPRDQWPAITAQLAARPSHATLVTSDGARHPVRLKEVTIERYVHRLRLDAHIDDATFQLLERGVPANELPLAKAVARTAIWEGAGRRGILQLFLTKAVTANNYQPGDATSLLRTVDNYKPNDAGELVARLPDWQKTLESEINVSGGSKPFFVQQIQAEHGGENDQRRRDEARLSAKQAELAFLIRLQHVLAN